MRADDRRLVTVAVFENAFEASLARGALGTFTRDRGGLSMTELLVFEEDRDRALDVLDGLQRR